MRKFKNYSLNDKIFYIIITAILTFFFIAVLYPCIFVLSASFSSGVAVQSGKVILFPVDLSIEGYRAVFNTSTVWTGFINSLFYTVVGTTINLVMTLTAAYCLSRRDLPGRNGIMLLFTFTMFFSGGMIPSYMMVQSLGILNTRWALLLPGAIGVYNLIVARTFIINSIPLELLEASQMDGCSDVMYYLKVVIPLSKAIIAVLVLFYGVGHWNAYFNAMIYLQSREKYPLQLFLREILVSGTSNSAASQGFDMTELDQYKQLVKYCTTILATAPILCIYPFLQKYFVKGVLIGSVKE